MVYERRDTIKARETVEIKFLLSWNRGRPVSCPKTKLRVSSVSVRVVSSDFREDFSFLLEMVKPGTFCGIKSRRVKIAFVLRVLFVLSLGSISVLNSYFGPSDGENVAVSKSRPRRHLLQTLQEQVELFPPIGVDPENFTEFPPVTTTESTKLPVRNCTPAAIFEFPSDGFTRQDRKHGWITVHLLIACYCFWLLAIVCDDYFVPAIELMCKSMSIRN